MNWQRPTVGLTHSVRAANENEQGRTAADNPHLRCRKSGRKQLNCRTWFVLRVQISPEDNKEDIRFPLYIQYNINLLTELFVPLCAKIIMPALL